MSASRPETFDKLFMTSVRASVAPREPANILLRRTGAPFGKRTILYVKMIFCTVMARSKTEPNGLTLTEDYFLEILQVLL